MNPKEPLKVRYRVNFYAAWVANNRPSGSEIMRGAKVSRGTVQKYVPFIQFINPWQEINERDLADYIKTFRGVESTDLPNAVAKLAEYFGVSLSEAVKMEVENNNPEITPNMSHKVTTATHVGLAS